jgi:hypothetical protein
MIVKKKNKSPLFLLLHCTVLVDISCIMTAVQTTISRYRSGKPKIGDYRGSQPGNLVPSTKQINTFFYSRSQTLTIMGDGVGSNAGQSYIGSASLNAVELSISLEFFVPKNS